MSGVLVVCHEPHDGLEQIAATLSSHGRLVGIVRECADTDGAAIEALRDRRPEAVLLNLGRGARLFDAARETGAACWLNANTDTWGVNRALRGRLDVEREPGTRTDLLPEIDADLEARANADIAVADRIFTASERMRVRLVELGIDGRRIAVIGQGVDCAAFSPVQLDTSARPLAVVTVARAPYAKGVDTAIAGAALSGVAASMTVVGAMPEAFRPRFPGVRFAGQLARPALVRELAASDVFVLPTLADNMPRAVLEAMASGLPVITTRESGYEGVITEGVEGFIVGAGDPDAIASRLRRLSTDGMLRARMATAARLLAERWSWAAFQERVGIALELA